MGTESCFLLMAASDPSQKMTSSNLHIYTYANLHKRNGHFLLSLGSRMVRLSTSALPAQGSVSCNSILTDYQGSVSWSMDNGVLGLTSWLRVLSALSIAGGSLEVTRYQLVFHFQFTSCCATEEKSASSGSGEQGVRAMTTTQARRAELGSHLPLLELAGKALAGSSCSSEKMCYHRSLNWAG